MNVTAAEIAAAIAFITAVVSIYLARSNRELLRADASEKITAAAAGLIEPLEKRIDELEAQNRLLVSRLNTEQAQRRALQHGVVVLIRQLEKSGIEPEWRPEGER